MCKQNLAGQLSLIYLQRGQKSVVWSTKVRHDHQKEIRCELGQPKVGVTLA